jgi:hypothetical protein
VPRRSSTSAAPGRSPREHRQSGWLGDAGVGLRISSVRFSTKDVLHVDVAFPFNATPDIKKVQLLIKGRTSF